MAYLFSFRSDCYWIFHDSYSICEVSFLGRDKVGWIDGGALVGGLDVWLDCFLGCKPRDTECKMLSVRRSANCGGLVEFMGAQVPVLQRQGGLGACLFAPQSLLCILQQLPDLLVRELFFRHVGEWCWVDGQKK